MTYRFRVGLRAERQIREAVTWWLKNRPKAPEAFAEDLERAFLLIAATPGAGEPVRHSSRRGSDTRVGEVPAVCSWAVFATISTMRLMTKKKRSRCSRSGIQAEKGNPVSEGAAKGRRTRRCRRCPPEKSRVTCSTSSESPTYGSFPTEIYTACQVSEWLAKLPRLPAEGGKYPPISSRNRGRSQARTG